MASPYTRERLAEAAASSTTISEMLHKLGVDPKSGTRRYIRARVRSMGIDVSHFQREGVRWTKEILEEAVKASVSINGVLRYLGIDAVGGHHAHISRRIKHFGIETSHFAPQRRTKFMKDNRRRRAPHEILVMSDSPHARRTPRGRLKRCLLEIGIAERCALCGTPPMWRGRPLVLEVDHIDGNWRDNRPENLRFLCPNCHSTTDTYRGRSKGRRGAGH